MNPRYTFTSAIRAARALLAAWVADGWLAVADPARKSRRYRLSAEYRQCSLSGNLEADVSRIELV